MASASDPSQFVPTPNASISNAAARRLGSPDVMAPVMAPVAAPTDPMAPQAPPQNNRSIGSLGPGPSGTLNTYGVTAPNGLIGNPDPNAQNPDPLIGGTGNAKLDSYLGTDATYQSQLSDLIRNYDQYNAQRNLAASQTQADYDAKQRALDTQATQDRLNMRNAAAARGILQSGIYANQLGQYNDANQQQLTNLLGGLQNSKDSAQLAYNNFISNELAAKEQAIQQAAARRSAQLGLV